MSVNKKLKKEFKEKLNLEKDYKSPIKWIIDVKFGQNKDKKFNKELKDYMILIAEGVWESAKSQYESILNSSNKGYIKIENIPAYEDIFGSIKDMIKSNEESIKYHKEGLVKLKRQKDKLKDYDKIKEIESKIWWEEHYTENYQKEIRFLQNMQEKIIRESHRKFKKEEESCQN